VKNTILTAIVLVCVSITSIGCVSQKHADSMQLVNRRLNEQILDLKSRLAECNEQIAAMRNAPVPQDPNLLNRLETVTAERDRLNVALQQAREALVAASQKSILPQELDQDLVELAETNRQLMAYDPQAGKLQLASDLTFALGSTKVSDQATLSLHKLAQIMAKPSAGRYELHIVGHTDNVRIARAATRAKHPTNWHLSVHRAIAVKDVLVKSGVNPQRLQVGGHGEYRPAVPNGRKGAQGNRRVEIYIVPNTYNGPGLAPGQSSSAAPTPAPARPAGGSTAPAAAPATAEPTDFFK